MWLCDKNMQVPDTGAPTYFVFNFMPTRSSKKKIMPTHCYKSLVRRVILYTHYFELAWTLHILECDGNLWIVSLSD